MLSKNRSLHFYRKNKKNNLILEEILCIYLSVNILLYNLKLNLKTCFVFFTQQTLNPLGFTLKIYKIHREMFQNTF